MTTVLAPATERDPLARQLAALASALERGTRIGADRPIPRGAPPGRVASGGSP